MYICIMEYYSAIKRPKDHVFCKDMDGPRDCHIEGSKSERENKYHILTLICGIWKNGTDEPICKAEIETQM